MPPINFVLGLSVHTPAKKRENKRTKQILGSLGTLNVRKVTQKIRQQRGLPSPETRVGGKKKSFWETEG